jgi:hypothetical protein
MADNHHNVPRRDPLIWAAYIIILAVIILYAVTRFLPSKTEIHISPPVNQIIKVEKDSLAVILLQKEINQLKETLIQTRSDMVKMSENTVSTSRDVIGLITFIVGLISIAGIYKIKSIKDELTVDINHQIQSGLVRLSQETVDGIEQIRLHKEYFDHIREIRSEDATKIMKAVDYFYGQCQTYKKDPYVISGFQQAINAISDHHLESRLKRTLVMLDDPTALDGLVQRYKDLTAQDRLCYKLALRGLVNDGFQIVEERLRKDGLMEEIMS